MKKYNLNAYSPDFTILNRSSGTDNIHQDYQKIFRRFNNNFVIKPDGLTKGKGVKLYNEHLKTYPEANDYINSILNTKKLNEMQQIDESLVLIEEKLEGDEFSIFTITDGVNCIHSPIFRSKE